VAKVCVDVCGSGGSMVDGGDLRCARDAVAACLL
jgi:hypothetical protein